MVTVTSNPHHRQIAIDVRQGFLGLTSYNADHQVEGIIEAGIDFTRIHSDSLRCEDTCKLVVPHPTITNCVTNCAITRLRQTDQSFAIGGRDWELLEELGRYEAIQVFIDDVTEKLKILDKAKDETDLVLGEFVSAVTGKSVKILFDDAPTELVAGPTCKPEQPFGWVKTDEGWSRIDE